METERILLQHPLVTENGTQITSVTIPSYLKLHHLDGVDLEVPGKTVIQLLERVSGIPEMYTRQLSLVDAGAIFRILTERLGALRSGYYGDTSTEETQL